MVVAPVAESCEVPPGQIAEGEAEATKAGFGLTVISCVAELVQVFKLLKLPTTV